MWNLPPKNNIRRKKLKKAEINLLMMAVASFGEQLVDLAKEGSKWETNIPCLDRMGAGELCLAVQQVVEKAVDPKRTTCDESSWEEAIMGFVLEEFVNSIESDFDHIKKKESADFFKKSLERKTKALQEIGLAEKGLKKSKLDEVSEELLGYFLWDDDYMMEDILMNAPRQAGEMTMENMGIGKEYFYSGGPSGTSKDEILAMQWILSLAKEEDKQFQ